MRDSAPLAASAFPVGVLVGVAIRNSDVVPTLAGYASSLFIFAGAAQLTALELANQGAGAVAVITAVAMINARHLMYSAALSHRFRTAPTWFRLLAPYLLIDQTFALNNEVTNPELVKRTVPEQMAYYLGTSVPLFIVWQIANMVGIFLGDVIPARWEVNFAVALMFTGLLVMSVADRPAVVAAIVGGAIAWWGRAWPSGTGLLLGAVAGVLAAALADRLLGSDDDAPATPATAASLSALDEDVP